MGNHDVYNTPADIAAEDRAKEFQEQVAQIYKRVCAYPMIKFSPVPLEDFIRVMGMPFKEHTYVPAKYTQDDLDTLKRVEETINKKKKSKKRVVKEGDGKVKRVFLTRIG